MFKYVGIVRAEIYGRRYTARDEGSKEAVWDAEHKGSVKSF
jgi:hypothetical protein